MKYMLGACKSIHRLCDRGVKYIESRNFSSAHVIHRKFGCAARARPSDIAAGRRARAFMMRSRRPSTNIQTCARVAGSERALVGLDPRV